MNWDFIAAAARPYFVKKIVLLGTESTGKSTLTEKLAAHFNAGYVPEMAREILEKTEDCKPEHLVEIAVLHANTILTKLKEANRLLFIDTDINITRSYSKFLFNETLHCDRWIEDANKADLYIFLEPDCEFVQDGTRLPNEERLRLNFFHKEQIKQAGITYFSVNGNWEERLEKSCELVKKSFKI